MPNAKKTVIQMVEKLPDSLSVDDIIRELLESTGWPRYPKLGIKYTREDIPLIEKICAAYSKRRLWSIAKVLKVDIADIKNGYKAGIVARMLDNGFTHEDIRSANRSLRK